jgi:hypothetical protein
MKYVVIFPPITFEEDGSRLEHGQAVHTALKQLTKAIEANNNEAFEIRVIA